MTTQESTEPQQVSGAEFCVSSDGACLCLATPQGPLMARGHLPATRAKAGAVFVGPAAFLGTFHDLSTRLAARGAATLVVAQADRERAAHALAAAAAFLRARGIQKLVLVGAGDAGGATLGAADGLDAESLVLLSPTRIPRELRADSLHGRPVVICFEDGPSVQPLKILPHAEFLGFPGAGEGFDGVRCDLAAGCLPRVERYLGLATPRREA